MLCTNVSSKSSTSEYLCLFESIGGKKGSLGTVAYLFIARDIIIVFNKSNFNFDNDAFTKYILICGLIGASDLFKGLFDVNCLKLFNTTDMNLYTGTQNAQILNYNQQALDITPTYKKIYIYKRVS